MSLDLKGTEAQTLSTFKKHRPSEYFSHINTKESFEAHNSRVENLYRFGLTFPPEFFSDKSLIDLGSGTGENTLSLAKWGAKCTLVEMNPDAVKVSKDVFKSHTSNFNEHVFINSSIYDLDVRPLKNSFDISHSRGVFTHVADKAKAFHILASLVKPGGYVIYGDRNTCGGIQEMLQRLAIYKIGGTNDEKIVEIAEALFSEDIDRSQRVIPRTREAIIFDRWVIQQQDDPSVEEVLNMFESEGLEYVSSWPKIDFHGRGVSAQEDPRNLEALKNGSRTVENLWMILNNGEEENIPTYDNEYYKILVLVSQNLRNLQIGTAIDLSGLKNDFSLLKEQASNSLEFPSKVFHRLSIFHSEVETFIDLILKNKELSDIRKAIDDFEILFKGYAGVRHVDYIGYKPK